MIMPFTLENPSISRFKSSRIDCDVVQQDRVLRVHIESARIHCVLYPNSVPHVHAPQKLCYRSWLKMRGKIE